MKRQENGPMAVPAVSKSKSTSSDSKGVAARRSELGRLEQIIQKGSKTFYETGLALAKIRDERLYEDEGFATFEDYCRDRWGWSHQRSSQLIQAAHLVRKLPPKLATYVADEMTARELRKLPDKKREQVIQQTIDQKLTLTPKLVRTHLPKPEPEPKSKEKLELEELAGVRELVRELLKLLEAVGPTHGVLHEVEPIAQWWLRGHNRADQKPSPATKPEPEPEEPPRRDPPKRGRLPDPKPDDGPLEPDEADPEPPAKGTKSAEDDPSQSRRFKHWHRINWRLQNRHLAAIWHLPAHNFRMMRYRKKHGQAQKANTDQYRQEIEAENVKAKAFMQTHPANRK